MARSKYEVRYVEWVDSAAQVGWTPLEEYEPLGPVLIKTAGFVLREDETTVAILQSHDERTVGGQPHGDNLIIIPKFAVSYSKTLAKGRADADGS